MWISLIAQILQAVANARGNAPQNSGGLAQLGSTLGSLISQVGSRKTNGNLSDRGFPSSR